MEIFSLDYLQVLVDKYVIPFGINLVIATVIFFVGRMVARLLRSLMTKLMRRAKVDEDVTTFLTDVMYSLMVAVVVVAALERLGVKTTAAIAIIGAAGLAVGLALQGSLGNFASGVMIILFKPYRIGDLVNIQGHIGHVDDIKVFVTVLVTLDGKTIIIPNGQATSGVIENISMRGKIRIDMVLGISYGSDLRQAKELLMQIMREDTRVLEDPAPYVGVCELADSSVNLATRPWVHPSDYWDVMFDTIEKAKLTFDANGISIPFPQRDVHMIQAQPGPAVKPSKAA